MYKDFYAFSDKPFKDVANPHFLFTTAALRKNLLSVISAIKEGKRIIAITGDVGVGKTTLIYALLRDPEPDISFAFVSNPNVTFEELMAAILGILIGSLEERNTSALMRAFTTFLEDKATRGEKVVILIDEAQTLTPGILADLLGLLDLETGALNPLQIILVGQPDLDHLLEGNNLGRAERPIGHGCRIQSLTKEESKQYIEQHLNLVGRSSTEVLTRDAIFLICRYSEGIPRAMNIICDNAFWLGWQRSQKKIDAAIVAEVIGAMYHRRQKLYHAWIFTEAFFLGKTLFFVEKAAKILPEFRRRTSRVYHFGKDFYFAKFLPAMKEGKSRIQGPLETFSLTRILEKDLLFGKTVFRVKASLRRISAKRHLFSRAYFFQKFSSFTKIPLSVDRAINKIHGQRQKLSYVWFFAKESLTKKIPYFFHETVIRLPLKTPQIKWRWIFGREILSKKFSFILPLAVIIFALGIFLSQMNIKRLFNEFELISKMEQILVAREVIPSLAEKDIEVVPDRSPGSVREKEETSENQLPLSQKLEKPPPEEKKKILIKHSPEPTLASKKREPTPRQAPAVNNFKANMAQGDIDLSTIRSPSGPSGKERPIDAPAPLIVRHKNGTKKPEIQKPIPVEKPVLIQSFASKQVKPGDIWKIYLKASDASRDIKYIFSTIEMGGSHLNIIEINEKNRRSFSGFIILDTYGADASLGLVNLTLNVSLKDSAGHFSESVAFPLSFQRNAMRAEPPPGIFKEQELGTVMIDLKPLLNQIYGE